MPKTQFTPYNHFQHKAVHTETNTIELFLA